MFRYDTETEARAAAREFERTGYETYTTKEDRNGKSSWVVTRRRVA